MKRIEPSECDESCVTRIKMSTTEKPQSREEEERLLEEGGGEREMASWATYVHLTDCLACHASVLSTSFGCLSGCLPVGTD